MVSGPTFGQIFHTSVVGQVYAQPLVSGNTLFIATEENYIYGLNPVTGAVLWSRQLGIPYRSADIFCSDLIPSVGITGTPVIDPASNTAYFLKKTYQNNTVGQPPEYWMHAVSLADGTERTNFPVKIQGTAQNFPTVSFVAKTLMNRPALLLMNGVVYAAFGSMCDVKPWQGWIVGVSTSGQIRTMWSAAAPGVDAAGIWQSGGGIVSDASGRIFVTTGNGGGLNTTIPSDQVPPTAGQSVVRLQVQEDGTLKPDNFFMPYDAAQLDTYDGDLGSTGPTALPDSFGTATYLHLMVQSGKTGVLYLLNRENLGGLRMGSGQGDNVLARSGSYGGGVWSHLAVWPGDGGYVYFSSAGSTIGRFNVMKFGLTGSGVPVLTLAAQSADAYGHGASAPIVTSDGSNSGSALVWIVWSADSTGVNSQLRAYDALPINGQLNLRYSIPIGTGSKFNPPGVGNNRIYVGTRDGNVYGFGVPSSAPLTGSIPNFGTVVIGQSATQPVVLTATSTVTVTSLVSNNSSFLVGPTTPPLGSTLNAGQTISFTVTYAPAAPGITAGSLTAGTDKGPVTFGLSGTGQEAVGIITATPTLVSLGGVVVGDQTTGNVTFSNIGATAVTVQQVVLPSAPFVAIGPPAANSSIQPGQSVTVSIQSSPTVAGAYSSELDLVTSVGTITVPITGNATPPSTLQITPLSVFFGGVAVGRTSYQSFTIKNVGQSNVEITKSKGPIQGQFFVTNELPEGTTLAAGGSMTVVVRFSPTVSGNLTDSWTINSDATSGLQVVTFTGYGLPSSDVPAPSLSGTLAPAPANQDLTQLGTADWTQYGLVTASTVNRKANVTPQIGTLTSTAGSSLKWFSGSLNTFTWSDGTPTASRQNLSTGVYVSGLNNGFTFTAPADSQWRSLYVFLGVDHAQGTLTATLSDNSAAPFAGSSLQSSTGTTTGTYVITYRTPSPGQTLTIRFVNTNSFTPTGYVSIQAVALQAPTVKATTGVLTASFATPPSTVLLNSTGIADWAHWGYSTAQSVERRAGITPLISDATPVNGATFYRFATNPTGYSWSGGTPVAAATDTHTGIYAQGTGMGFQLTVPADQTQRTLTLYLGLWKAQGLLKASLSDGSASDLVDVSLMNPTGTSNGTYKLVYRSSSPGQTLRVTYSQLLTGPWGNVTLEAATLSTTVTGGTVTLSGLKATYDGSPKAVTATTVPAGLTVDVTYNGSATAPTNAGSYAVVATIDDPTYQGRATGTLVIAKATPVVSWNRPADIAYGTALSSAQLNATANVPGSFVYSPPAGTVLAVGDNQLLSTWFTPTNTANYNPAAATTLIDVTPKTATVTLSGLNTTYNGSPKAVTVTTVPAGLTVNVTYNGSATPPTNAGSYAVVATVQGSTYQGSTTGTLVIAKATPVISWNKPADIAYGTPLSSTQLNATANVPGSFVYTPPAGTVLAVGNNQALSTSFTPTSTTNYNLAAATTTINVVQPPNLAFTPALSRNAQGNIVLQLTVSNSGAAANNVQLMTATLNGVSGTPLPQSLNTIPAGGQIQITVQFPSSINIPAGTRPLLALYGTFTNGSFARSYLVTMP